MTPNDIITEVRREIQDSALLRTPDTHVANTLLGYVNRILKQTALLRPDLFMRVSDITPQPNSASQVLPDEVIRLVDIFSVKDGNAVSEVSREVLNQSHPTWMNDAAGVPVNYMRHVKNPKAYFLYPRPAPGVVLVGEYVRTPPNYTVNQDIEDIPDSFLPALVAGVASLVYGMDNATQSRDKAMQFQESYSQVLGVNLQGRVVTDTKSSGLDPKQVL